MTTAANKQRTKRRKPGVKTPRAARPRPRREAKAPAPSSRITVTWARAEFGSEEINAAAREAVAVLLGQPEHEPGENEGKPER